MKALILTAALSATALALVSSGCSRQHDTLSPASGVSAEQRIVDRAANAVSAMRKNPEFRQLEAQLPQARGVLIFPRVIKAALFLGGEGGNGVLMARAADGRWSAPAFYSVGSGSVGLQLGYQEAAIVLLLMNESTLFSVIEGGITLGADASVAAGTVGEAGQSRSSKTSADVIQFADVGGVFAGVSLDGAVIQERESFNRRYYGPDANAFGILVQRQFDTAGADVIQRALD